MQYECGSVEYNLCLPVTPTSSSVYSMYSICTSKSVVNGLYNMMC